MPDQIDFRRILGRRDVAVLGIEDIETGVQRHGLTAARGTGHQDHALRFGEIFEVSLALDRLVSQGIDAEHRARGIQYTRDDLLAEQRRAGAHAKIDGPILREPHLDASVLRYAPLGDIQSRHDFEARDDLDGELHRGQRNLFEHAVQTRADAEYLFVGFEVNVRCALLDRIQQYLVDEAHDRRVFDVVAAECRRFGLFVAAADLEVFEIDIVVGELRHHRFGLIDGLVDRLLQLVVFDDDEFDAHRGLESDLVERMQIGRIGNRKEQALAALHQRHHAVLLQQLIADESEHFEIRHDRIHVEQRDAEFVRGGNRDIARGRDFVGNQVGHEAQALFLRLAYRIMHCNIVQQAVLDEALGEATEGRLGCRPRLLLKRCHSWT